MSSRRFPAPLWVALAAACSAAPAPAPLPSDIVEFSLEVRVPAGTETRECKLVAVPRGDYVVEASHAYTPGSHHLLVFRTDLSEIPAELQHPASCDESGRGFMSHVRGILYGSQVPTGQMRLPEGVGLSAPAGSVLLLQAHYINTGPRDLDARVTVRLRMAEAQRIREEAGVLFFYHPFIHVPAGATAAAEMACGIRQDIRLLSGVSHFHERGMAYAAYVDPPATSATSPFYTTDDWEHPEPLQSEGIPIAAGSRIRFRCEYDNTAGTRDYYQGQSAADNEMCIFSGLYYPAMERRDELCMTAPEFGGGTASCAATTSCLLGCPPGSAPSGAPGAGSGLNVSECWQRCLAAMCLPASRPLFDQLSCIGANCRTDCATSAALCRACVGARCAAQLAACAASGCGG